MPNKKVIDIHHSESFSDISEKGKRLESFIKLSNDIREKERRVPVPFNEFLYLASSQPEMVFRDIFQLFHDMVKFYVEEGIEDYYDNEESVGFLHYNLSNLFVEGCDSPFFADRLFANRLMSLMSGFRSGTQNRNIFLFEGPPGSGKSTFLNNLLRKLEDYTKTDEGTTYKIYWRLDTKLLGGFEKFGGHHPELTEEIQKLTSGEKPSPNNDIRYPERYLEFSCPNHDHPILLIPKSYRRNFLDELIQDEDFKEKLFYDKQYEWVLKETPCNICSSIYKTLLDTTSDPLLVYSMVRARKNFYSRQFGEGISVFNPGDPVNNKLIQNPTLQRLINDLFKNDDINFVSSYLSKTNDGILALMDIKEYNVERLKNYHGIISDGVHKVELAEERVKTLFLGLVNPEDKVHYEKVMSFQDRIINVNIPYILDYKTEVAIYKSKFGDRIGSRFLPGVLDNFAKIIISSRMDKDSPAIRQWLINPDVYRKYIDRDLLLLKMDIYTGKIPEWLSEEDMRRFNKDNRKSILEASESEGKKGFSGRQSLLIFGNFLALNEDNDKPITMDNVRDFFLDKKNKLSKEIPDGFIDSLVDLYDYSVVQQVKEAIFFYNEEQITRDIENYLFAINFEPGEMKTSDYTGEKIEITEEYFKNFEALFLGTTSTIAERETFRKSVHKEYISKTLSQEIRRDGKPLVQTELFSSLFEKYTRNIKENALAPYAANDNFRRAIIDYGTDSFASYEQRMKRDIQMMIANLINKFNYEEEGAKHVCIYVLDKKISKKY